MCYTSKAIGPKVHNKTQYTLTLIILICSNCPQYPRNILVLEERSRWAKSRKFPSWFVVNILASVLVLEGVGPRVKIRKFLSWFVIWCAFEEKLYSNCFIYNCLLPLFLFHQRSIHHTIHFLLSSYVALLSILFSFLI